MTATDKRNAFLAGWRAGCETDSPTPSRSCGAGPQAESWWEIAWELGYSVGQQHRRIATMLAEDEAGLLDRSQVSMPDRIDMLWDTVQSLAATTADFAEKTRERLVSIERAAEGDQNALSAKLARTAAELRKSDALLSRAYSLIEHHGGEQLRRDVADAGACAQAVLASCTPAAVSKEEL